MQLQWAGGCIQWGKWCCSQAAQVQLSRWTIAHLHIEYIMQTETGHQLFSKLLILGLAIKRVCVIDFMLLYRVAPVDERTASKCFLNMSG